MKKSVFVIHGRDTGAHAELVKFIRAVGLDVLAFEAVASELGPTPFVADVVATAISKADAVIALFTPDEQAVLHDPVTGRSLSTEASGSRWQARPNVLFEAGVAYGRPGKEPILAVLGVDVSLFSDVGGKHFVQLEKPGAKRQLFDRLDALVGPLSPTLPDWETSLGSGDFSACVRRRWEVFDEVEELSRYLANRQLKEKKPISLLEIVADVVLSDRRRDWKLVDARDLMEAIQEKHPRCTDRAYWWLVVYGFFQFDNIEYWGTVRGATWDDCVDQTRLAPRGAALIERVRARAPEPKSAGTTPSRRHPKPRKKSAHAD